MATNKLNSKSPTIRRILREAQELAASPSGDFAASPLETDLFEWHFTLRGPPGSAYADGVYHGRIVLPPTYPLRPPSFRFLTPSGRFEANREICLSISGHHEETWQPAWGLRTALVALRAFMETDPRGQVGGLDASDAARRTLATASTSFRCATCGRTNAEILQESAEAETAAAAAAAASGSSSTPTPENVPPELKMVFRDELGTPAETAETADTPENPQNLPPASAPATAPPAAPAPLAAPAAPAQPPTLSPTRTTPLPAPAAAPPAVTAPPAYVPYPPAVALRPRTSDEAVPLWVDRSIAGLCVILVAMLLKMILQ